MSSAPRWAGRLKVGTLSILTVGATAGVGFAGALASSGSASASTTTTASTMFGAPPAPISTAPPGPEIGEPPIAVTDLQGTDRFATAATIAVRAFPRGASTAIVVSGATQDLADALAASYLAAGQDNGAGAPILLVDPTSVPTETTSALATLMTTHIIIVGGTGAVSASVANALASGTVSVTRVSGINRFATADAVDSLGSAAGTTGATGTGSSAGPVTSPAVGTAGGKKYAIVADGQDQDLVDALGASPIADAGPFPVFLLNGAGGTLSSADLSTMKADGITDALLVGGFAAIGPQVTLQLNAASITPTQVAGTNRSATSVALADFAIKNLGFSNTHFNIASGDQAHLVDSLAGGPLGGSQKAPTLITSSVNDPGAVVSFVSEHLSTELSVDLFGGFDAVGPTALAGIASPSGVPTPVAGVAAAEADAAALLANPAVPATAVPVASAPVANPPTTYLDQAATSEACLPLIDDALYWVVPNTTGAALSAYLQVHLTPGITLGGATVGGNLAYYFVMDRPSANAQSDSLVFTAVDLGGGSVGLRADAQAAPSGAMCSSAGGGGLLLSGNGPPMPVGGPPA